LRSLRSEISRTSLSEVRFIGGETRGGWGMFLSYKKMSKEKI